MTQPEADDNSDPHSDASGPLGRTDQSRADPDQPRSHPDQPHAGPDDPGPEPDEPRMDIGILVTIRSLLPNLAPVEQRVAQAVLDDPGGAARRSISELSRSCGTSATTVVRFCRAVGLRGYPELRLALAAAVAHGDASAVAAASHDISPGDDAALIAKKIAHADALAVTETANHLDVNALVNVVNLLATANRIDIYGVGASGFVALDLQQKLQCIGPGVRVARSAHGHHVRRAARGRRRSRGPVAYRGDGRHDRRPARGPPQRGHDGRDKFPWSPITEVADFVLLTAARETAFRSGAMTSRIAQLTVVDCLFVVLAQRDLPTTEASLERTYTAAQAKRTRRARRADPPCPATRLPPRRGDDRPACPNRPPGDTARRPASAARPAPRLRDTDSAAGDTAPAYRRLSGRSGLTRRKRPFALCAPSRVPSIAVSSAPAQW